MKLRYLLILLALTVLLSTLAAGQSTRGCCCLNGVEQTRSVLPSSSSCDPGFNFFTLTSTELFDQTFTCVEKCDQVFGQSSAVCGDSTCDSNAGEDSITCPQDCGVQGGCPPGLALSPSNLRVIPQKGQKAIRIDYDLACTPDFINITRCDNTGCSVIAEIPPATSFIDRDQNLQFNKSYRYEVRATYLLDNKASLPAEAQSTLGDIECLGQTTFDKFCISEFYYEQYRNYFSTFGYFRLGAQDWANAFSPSVRNTFRVRFNQGWQCNAANELISAGVNCAQGEFCIADNSGISCLQPGPCALGKPFGLFVDQKTCEGNSSVRNYCTYDRSDSSVNSCFECEQSMSCYDYRSKGACQRNNCGAGVCKWRDMLPDLGIGVCIDERINNCPNCEKPALRSTNAVLDQCNSAKASALSTPEFPCFFNRQTAGISDCNSISCQDYTPSQCGSPTGGIKLNGDNSVKDGSADPCGLQVCAIEGSFCFKNADGTPQTQVNWQDCVQGDQSCELDYFAPVTSLIPIGASGRFDRIQVRILDKQNATTVATDKTSETGYSTHLCVVSSGNDCNDASTFPIDITGNQLIVSNQELKENSTVLANLALGANTVRYYSSDPASNLEVVKELLVVSCNNCSGPLVIDVTLLPGNEVKGSYYTNSRDPIIRVAFDGPTRVQFAALTKKSEIVETPSQSPSGSSVHQLVPNKPLDGSYLFGMDALNNNNVGMDPALSFNLTFDDVAPTVTVTPPNNQGLASTSTPIELSFSEKVLLENVTLYEERVVTPFQIQRIPLDLVSRFASLDDITHTFQASGLNPGKYTIEIIATDFAGNRVETKSIFFVRTNTTSIRLKAPNYGVFSNYTFPLTVETVNPGECKHLYDTPSAPAPTQDNFDVMNDFDSTGGLDHTINSFTNIPSGDLSTHTLHVLCKDAFGIASRSFDLRADLIAPELLGISAFPNPIAESDDPKRPVYTTFIRAQMNEQGFCRYSNSTADFSLMEEEFSGFDLVPKKVHTAKVQVPGGSNNTYRVACKDLGGLVTNTQSVSIGVDLNASLKIISTTNPYSNSTVFSLSVQSNKRSLCFYGETNNSISLPLGGSNLAREHTQDILSVNGTGKLTYYVQCTRATGTQEVSSILPIDVIIDTTPPLMSYVNDSTALITNPQVSFFNQRLLVAFLAVDTESSVTQYQYLIETSLSKNVILDWTTTTVTDGKSFYVTGFNLTDGEQYNFRVRPINIVGLVGAELESDGVTIDTSLLPEQCLDTVRTDGETDVDCGGVCGSSCGEGKNCNEDNDCSSLRCSTEGKCAAPSCNDGVASPGYETGVDCGGDCTGCPNGVSCIVNTDCTTNYCGNGICGDAPPCADGLLTPGVGETDIDCGGTCPTACDEGQNCEKQDDCGTGLSCSIGNTCQVTIDDDRDGIPNDRDRCPGSSGEVDEEGCDIAQRFSCGDSISDGWRQKYFGSVLCSGNGAEDYDHDRDGLTNAEEFTLGTDPTAPDTDGDGYSDGAEYSRGTDPLDSESTPTAAWLILLLIFTIFAGLAGIGYGGYYGYNWYEDRKDQLVKIQKKRQVKKQKDRDEQSRKNALRKSKQEALRRLKNLARQKPSKSKGYVDISKIGNKKKGSTTKKDRTSRIQEKLARLKK
jgi:hypothetical protein